MNKRTLLSWSACSALAISALTLPAVAGAGPESCDTRDNNTHAKLLECVTLDGVRAHQAAFQAIADANGGTRASGTPGYDASVDYVAQALSEAGYDVVIQPFDYTTFVTLSPTVLEQVTPPPAGPVPNTIMAYSGNGDVTASVSALPAAPGDPTPGCEPSDFAGFPAGSIALIERGTCTFALKATNAYAAGAVGVVIYNNIPGTLNGTLGSGFTLDIPVTSVTQDIGTQLAALVPTGLALRLKVDALRGLATSYNVLAETRDGNPGNVVMAGAHLDSVNAGPGINDNGSGSAALLETAIQMAKVKPRNKVRFAWWGAEESGLVGSSYYVSNLTPEELDQVALYLDFHIIGSPNHVFFVYDGDDSDGVGGGPGPDGSAQIEALFEYYYAMVGQPSKGTDLNGLSDYGPFLNAGIPVGGISTGSLGIKTPDEAALWGGTAGDQYDPCYHLACDTYDNVNLQALDVNADAVAYSVLQFAMSTETVNGVRGKGNFSPRRSSGHATH